MKNKMNPSRVPVACAHLMSLAERWAIGDDVEMDMAIETAPTEELQYLVNAILSLPDDTMFDWLAGPESQEEQISEEYVAFSCLVEAYDSARWELEKRSNSKQGSPNQSL